MEDDDPLSAFDDLDKDFDIIQDNPSSPSSSTVANSSPSRSYLSPEHGLHEPSPSGRSNSANFRSPALKRVAGSVGTRSEHRRSVSSPPEPLASSSPCPSPTPSTYSAPTSSSAPESPQTAPRTRVLSRSTTSTDVLSDRRGSEDSLTSSGSRLKRINASQEKLRPVVMPSSGGAFQHISARAFPRRVSSPRQTGSVQNNQQQRGGPSSNLQTPLQRIPMLQRSATGGAVSSGGRASRASRALPPRVHLLLPSIPFFLIFAALCFCLSPSRISNSNSRSSTCFPRTSYR